MQNYECGKVIFCRIGPVHHHHYYYYYSCRYLLKLFFYKENYCNYSSQLVVLHILLCNLSGLFLFLVIYFIKPYTVL